MGAASRREPLPCSVDPSLLGCSSRKIKKHPSKLGSAKKGHPDFSVGLHGKSALLILPSNPIEARQAGGANTRRAARTMRVVSGRHMDVPSGNATPACASAMRSVADGPTGWPSLVTFLATQESDPRKARNAFDLGQEPRLESQPHTGFQIPQKKTGAELAAGRRSHIALPHALPPLSHTALPRAMASRRATPDNLSMSLGHNVGDA